MTRLSSDGWYEYCTPPFQSKQSFCFRKYVERLRSSPTFFFLYLTFVPVFTYFVFKQNTKDIYRQGHMYVFKHNFPSPGRSNVYIFIGKKREIRIESFWKDPKCWEWVESLLSEDGSPHGRCRFFGQLPCPQGRSVDRILFFFVFVWTSVCKTNIEDVNKKRLQKRKDGIVYVVRTTRNDGSCFVE